MTAASRRPTLVGLVLVATFLGPAGPASGSATDQQLARGDSAWGEGRYTEAVAAYDSALAADPLSTRANFRKAVWFSWENRLDSALVRIRGARAAEPTDGDLMVTEARFLAWQGRLKAAVALYDTVLAQSPERSDAHLGRAQALAWDGRYAEADSAYLRALQSNPDDPAALIGRAQVMEWAGERHLAEALYLYALDVDPNDVNALIGLARLRQRQWRIRSARQELGRVLALEPDNRAARLLAQDLRAAGRPQLELGTALSNDSDKNLVWSHTLSTSMAVTDGLRGFVNASSMSASDPVREADRVAGELGLAYAYGAFQISAAGGARRLLSPGAIERSVANYRTVLSARLSKRTGAGVGFAHHPFDENAFLVGSGLDVDEIEGNVESTPTPGLTLSGGAGLARLSDGNRNRRWTAALTKQVDARWSVGALARTLAYDRRGVGYFSPNRFQMAEARGSFSQGRRQWESSTRAGLGLQQVGRGAAAQLAWRLEQTLAYRWGSADQSQQLDHRVLLRGHLRAGVAPRHLGWDGPADLPTPQAAQAMRGERPPAEKATWKYVRFCAALHTATGGPRPHLPRSPPPAEVSLSGKPMLGGRICQASFQPRRSPSPKTGSWPALPSEVHTHRSRIPCDVCSAFSCSWRCPSESKHRRTSR
jgi:tetratricopeptide (TPR) repeat protein